MESFERALADQAGVISRKQLLGAGCAPHDIKRMLRRRDLARIGAGVYVSHTGPPSWIEQAWAALLAASADGRPEGVALAHRSALRITEGAGRRSGDDLPIHVAIPAERRVRPAEGVVIHRTQHFDERIADRRLPPRIRYEEAVLDVASDLAPLDALGVLTRAVSGRRSTAGRLLIASRARARVGNRPWLEAVLADIDQGTHSVLEHGFLTKVIRPHALPSPRRQHREETVLGVVYRDASFGDIVIELDGRLHGEQRDADLDRDLYVVATGRRTVRLGWGQVYGRPCRTASLLSVVLSGGRPCGHECHVGR